MLRKNKAKVRAEEDELKILKTQVDKIFTDTSEVRDQMRVYKDRFMGKWWNKDNLGEHDSDIVANLLFSTVMTIAPLLTDNRPIWSVRARKPHMQRHIEAYSLCLEYLWDKLEMDDKTLEWVLFALIKKMGVIYTGFNYEEDEIEIEVVDPVVFFVAPGYKDNWKAPLQGTRESKPLSWIRSRFPETGKDVKAEEDGSLNDASGDHEWQLHNKFATVYTVWFKDGATEEYYLNEAGETVDEKTDNKKIRKKYPHGRIKIFAQDQLLEDKPSIFSHGNPPWVMLYDYKVPGEFIGMGEADQMESMNRSFNRNLQLMDKWTQFYCDPPWFVDSGAGLEIETVKEELLAGGGIFEYNRMNSGGEPPIVKPTAPQYPDASSQMMTGLLKLIEEITGVTDISKGMTTKAQRQSATEISTLIESSYTRTRQRVRNLEFSIKRMLYLVLSNMQQFYTEPKNFSIQKDQDLSWYKVGNTPEMAKELVGPPQGIPEEMGKEFQTDYLSLIKQYGKVDKIYAEFDLEIQTNSMLPMDRQSLANLFLRLLEMAAGNPATALPLWEATLERLDIPKAKEIIAQMKQNFAQERQQQ